MSIYRIGSCTMKRNKILIVAGILIALCAPSVSLAFLDTLDAGATEVRYSGTNYSSRVGQSFLGSDYSTEFQVQLSEHGTMSDDLVFEIRTVSSGVPSETILDSVAVSPSVVGVSCETVSVTLPDLTLDAGTTYAVVFSRVGSLSNTDFYAICSTGYDDYSSGTNFYQDGTWSTDNIDFALKMYSDSPVPEPLAPDLSISTSTAPFWLSAVSQFVFFSTLFFLLGIATSIWILVRFFK